ncbi:hypothetical protein G6N05_04640 [Flavobacterium sp. F372]|uniref:Uncharacterized protein n=1 Tax=Flavobacterium bernardetii TaxID=2813823 RepID=A0ABR7IWK5_9FLAO|nr:hypothetical protein [Flavobacterium bernardetii]MBC5834165.1 hypothetical protein [Flavobacterium bernardetii]NHF69397.1 hypothetical protein [Flavobacterium bernardetii]
MNDAHLHMVVNHFPIIGLFFGLLILLFGIIRNNGTLKSTAYIIFIFCMIMGKVSMMTGDKAEHAVEEMAGFSHDYIHEHEEAAELFMKPLYVLGIVSIFGFVTVAKKRSSEKIVSICALLIAAICLFLSKDVGTTGGEIRHTEIRENTSNSNASEGNAETETTEDKD